MFTHDKFEAYKMAIEFVHLALQMMVKMPSGSAVLKDQLRRAAFSIPLNIAEGTGKTGRADRLRFYSIARGSAMECAALCDVIALLDLNLVADTAKAKEKLLSIVKILSTVCRGGETGAGTGED